MTLTLCISHSDFLDAALFVFNERLLSEYSNILAAYLFCLKGNPFKEGSVVRYFTTSILLNCNLSGESLRYRRPGIATLAIYVFIRADHHLSGLSPVFRASARRSRFRSLQSLDRSTSLLSTTACYLKRVIVSVSFCAQSIIGSAIVPKANEN